MIRKKYFDFLLNSPSDKNALDKKKKELLQYESAQAEVLYKFCSIENAYKIFTTGNILLQFPDNFNDPYDCLSGISIWDNKLSFGIDENEKIILQNLLKEIPTRFKSQTYNLFNDLRSSYYFAASCFTTCFKNPLMWSHYSDKHYGVCLEFKIADLLDDLHPCYYTQTIPDLNWSSKIINLSLIKSSAWSYENEWRYVIKTNRPIMRVFGQITSQIYSAIHTDKSGRYSQKDYEEWGKINSELHKKLEDECNKKRAIFIKPSKIYLGLNYYHNYSNTKTGDICKKIITQAEQNQIPIRRMRANSKGFDFYDEQIDDLALKHFKGDEVRCSSDDFFKKIL